MKKLLTIIALALILCLSVSSALAADITNAEKAFNNAATKYGDEWTNGAAALIEAATSTENLFNGVRVNYTKAQIQNMLANQQATAIHAEFSKITLDGTKYKAKDDTKTYTKVTDDLKFDMSKDKIYYKTKNDKGEDVYLEITDKSKVSSGWVYTWKDDKNVEHTSDAYTLKTTYNYKDEGYASVELRVMLVPHDKLGGSTTGSDGKVTYKCSCGKEWEAAAPVDPATCTHEWAWKPVEGKEATCVKAGRQVQYCVLCNKVNPDTEKDAPMIDHNYEVTEIIAPDCIENTMVAEGWSIVPGKVSYKCSMCGQSFQKNIGVGDYRALLQTEYGYTAAEANTWETHTYSYATIEPTCAKREQEARICTKCHQTSIYDKIGGKDSLDANYVAVKVPNCKEIKKDAEITFKCSLCGSATAQHPVLTYKIKEDDVNALKATYMVNKTVTIDGHDVSFTLMHTGELKEVDAKKRYVSWNEDGTAKVDTKVEDATCGQYICNQFSCSVCESKTIAKKVSEVKHTWGEWKLTIKADDINQYKRVCTICGQPETSWGTEPPKAACEDGKHVPAKKYNGQNCKSIDLRPAFDAKEYVWADMYCTVCGVELPGELVPIEHEWKLAAELGKPATCTETGTEVYVCEVCDKSVMVETALADHELVKTDAVAATCKTKGAEAYYTCKNCKAKFSDAEGLNEISAIVKTPIDPEAHKWDKGVETKPAAEGVKGVKTFTCELCGKTKTEEIPALPVPPKYAMTASYDGKTVTGKLVHDEASLEADVKNVRVTFYIEGNYYMATMAEVAADGTFSVDGVGPIVYITVAATGNTSVNPEDYQKIAEPVEIFVK